jgi:ACS family D-galactonate transporter-like MFS transporter
MLNYLDRTVLGIAAPSLTKDLGLTAAMMGVAFSAFSWSYALLQIPGGIFLDRFGTRRAYTVALVGWSACTAAMGLVVGLPQLVLTRIGVGMFEAPCFPANSRVLASWFPQQERARANAIYSVGQYAGIGFFSVPLFLITQAFGWRWLFGIVGAIGVVFGLLWWRVYRGSSAEHEGQRRRDAPYRIRRRRRVQGPAGAIQLEPDSDAAAPPAGGGGVHRPVRWQLDTGLLSHLVSHVSRHSAWNDLHQRGAFGIVPYIGASVGVLVGGFLSDFLLKRTGSANLARKLPIVSGLLLASTIIAANYVPAGHNGLVIAVMSVAFFGQGLTNLGWTVLSDIAPKQVIGLTAGIFNFSANVAGILTPVVIASHSACRARLWDRSSTSRSLPCSARFPTW